MRTTVQLDAREMSIKVAGIFGTKIPYKSIDYVAPAESTGLAAGMGLRVLQNRTTGYLVGGPSVRISLDHKNGAPNTKFEAPSLANSLVTGRL